MHRKKKEKPEDFIGWKSPDGNLEVIGIHGRQGTNYTFKVVCKICSQDPELFPLGYFVSRKEHLCNGSKPCGCSKKTEWDKEQFFILAKRAGSEKGFIVHGFAEEFHGQTTKLDCECLIDGNKWTPSLTQLIYLKQGCPECAIETIRQARVTPEQEALALCIAFCNKHKYKPIGFVGQYQGIAKTRFEYECPEHGKHDAFIYNIMKGTKCPSCAVSGYNPNKAGSFYIVKWTKENHSFIKFGITNRKVLSRIKDQMGKTNYKHEILFQKTWKDGYIPLNIEKTIKNSNLFKLGVVDSVDFKDGFTETIEIQYLSELNYYIENILKGELD